MVRPDAVRSMEEGLPVNRGERVRYRGRLLNREKSIAGGETVFRAVGYLAVQT